VPRKLLIVCIAASVLMGLPLVAGAAGSSLPRIRWHDSWEQALKAASRSHKPIYFFVYARDDSNSNYMWEYTLVDPKVVKQLAHFEACALNAKTARNHEFLRRYNLAVSKEPTVNGVYRNYLPANLFTDERGRKLYAAPVYMEPDAMCYLLQQMLVLDQSLDRIAKNSNDACAYAQAGHVYLELCLYDQARTFLDKAVALDPDNKSGAKKDAVLDLIILDIPASSEEQQVKQALTAYNKLQRYLRSYPRSGRELEARYFMAVCQYIAHKPREALKILDYFYGPGKSEAFNNNVWTQRALGLRKAIRRELGLSPE